MKTSEQLDLLATALAKAQGEMNPASKDSTNPHFKSKYADLASAWLAAQGPVSRNGLAILQGFEPGLEKSLIITTRLVHSSGQWVESTLPFYPLDQKPQTLGSCITYGRRYSLMAILGIVPDDDDDGNAASREAPPVTRSHEPELFDMHNESHKVTFKGMLKTQFPLVPETLYRSIAKDCHGKPANESLSKVVENFLSAHDQKMKNSNGSGMLQKLIEKLESTGQNTVKVTGKTPMELMDLPPGLDLDFLVMKMQSAIGTNEKKT